MARLYLVWSDYDQLDTTKVSETVALSERDRFLIGGILQYAIEESSWFDTSSAEFDTAQAVISELIEDISQ